MTIEVGNDGNIGVYGEPIGSDILLVPPNAGHVVIVRGFQMTVNQIGGATCQLHFGLLAGFDVRWSCVSTFNVPTGLGRCDIVGPVNGILRISVNKLTADPDGTWNGWFRGRTERAI